MLSGTARLSSISDASPLALGDFLVELCPSLLSIAVIKIATKSNWRREGLNWWMHVEHTVHHEGKPRQDLKQDRNLQRP